MWDSIAKLIAWMHSIFTQSEQQNQTAASCQAKLLNLLSTTFERRTGNRRGPRQYCPAVQCDLTLGISLNIWTFQGL